MARKIGDTLRESRISAGISVEQISDILTQKGYKASIKTIYSWESGNSSPGPDALLEMCDIYKIDNILATFGYDGYRDDGSLKLNLKENQIIEKYRSLTPAAQSHVDAVLDWEVERSGQLQQSQERITELEAQAAASDNILPMVKDPAPDYLTPNAAHADDYAHAPENLKQLEEDIMDDENF